jgi:hypothetical protein
MKVNNNRELNMVKGHQSKGWVSRTSLRFLKKKAHKEDRANAKLELAMEIAA